MTHAQSDLFGAPPGPPQRHRLFFAVMPDEDARQNMRRAAGMVSQHHADIRPSWIEASRYHATLLFLGDYPGYPEDIVRKAKLAGEHVKAPAFSWTLDYVASFRGAQPPCVLRSTVVPKPFMTLKDSLNTALVYAGLQQHFERQFVPHVTLAYGQRELPEATPVTPITWRVDRVLLIDNIVGNGGYQIIGSWPLAQ